ncbi:VOC family protein [Cohaesibacter celericrescens]|uniref:Glyoxalase n=1 Tax=Cohaesibacter celericrescens TaxID=2067669 RepID=A0A2N5XMS1_9HYPH|nr:VOC family protein [Cohaesibacter celericrescens]PLW75785.1 glyoxalase [Cohaesibacter celericrescens]
MEARISLVTLGVKDLERSVAFYRDGLGWETAYEVGQGVAFFKTKGTVFALYPIDQLAEEVPDTDFKPTAGPCGITLAHNCRERSEVDVALDLAAKAGAVIKKPGADTFWGGYSGYFSDPDGYLWEVAHGAFPLDKDGHLVLP